ncbi:hypothetical protein ThrDRAFT_01919 [Frankia casuarinae]|uniref:Phosphoribosyl transferase n=2 Tax=Frankia casuarinae (strain DSM 45818 / CECT 9043 / HFP020203 / CcI3) TaxID=106370 RepID=Q2J6S1_FRACC|nr:phosphoribosyltransferase family protein [Frankia casuarinae]ABD13021.1 conserved hypothetical protein [Frankia casuarinae]EYT92470.1 hypothetical protein ThrDRAFT_01919 [Frankia casuarinae]
MTATAGTDAPTGAPIPHPPAPAPARGPAAAPAGMWLWTELGLDVQVTADVAGQGLHALVGLALRRNPRRAHLLVSRVLGKHLPVAPAEALAAGAGVAALVRALPGFEEAGKRVADPRVADPPVQGSSAEQPGGPRTGPIVIGYCETATALGHAVADGLPASHYLHTTRRPLPGVTPILEFVESHSHATHHWLMPEDREILRCGAPIVLVDDELSTGRTALGTIRILQAHAPREHYVVATLLDARPPAARAAFADLADELGVRLDVVAPLTATVTVPAEIADRAARIRARFAGGAGGRDAARATGALVAHPVRRLVADWPSDLPDGGRHRWSPTDRHRLDEVVPPVAATVLAALTRPAGRTLVLGTEELMYTPMRIADALARTSPGEIRYQSTTRSPVHPVDVDGYAIRAALTFPAPDDPGRASHVYNVRPGMYDDIVVVVDSVRVVDSVPDVAPGADRSSPRADTGLHGMLTQLRRCAPVTVLTLPSYQPSYRPSPRPTGAPPAAGPLTGAPGDAR